MKNLIVALKALFIFLCMILFICLYLYGNYSYSNYKGGEPILAALMFLCFAFDLGFTYWNHNKRESF